MARRWRGRGATIGPQPRFWPERRSPRRTRRLAFAARPFALLAVLLLLWPTLDAGLVEPPAFLATEPEVVDAQFELCGRERSFACVVDGDTFRLGERRIRIIGIDAPETREARCAEEAALGQAATVRLQQLLNAGPFVMVGRMGDARDRYGRELRALSRQRNGQTVSIGGQLRSEGHARRYLSGLRGGWC